jgi:hypothetical protein
MMTRRAMQGVHQERVRDKTKDAEEPKQRTRRGILPQAVPQAWRTVDQNRPKPPGRAFFQRYKLMRT